MAKKTSVAPPPRASASSLRQASPVQSSPAPRKQKKSLCLPRLAPYAAGFALLWIFGWLIYGDVFARAALDNYVCADAESMRFLTHQDGGYLYWGARYVLTLYAFPWLGSLLLAALLTAIAWLFDKSLRLPARGRGAGFVASTALLAYFVSEGTDLFFLNEPSRIFAFPIVATVVLLLVYALLAFLPARRQDKGRIPLNSWGLGIVIALFAGLWIYADRTQQNTILGSRQALLCWKDDWKGMIELARSARHPSRTVAAYHAIALVETNRILEEAWTIDYDFPDMRQKRVVKGGKDESALYCMDANFFAGLTNTSYRDCMDYIVMNGPRLLYLQRMTVCAILNGETALADKYLDVIAAMPFTGDFVEKYRMLAHDENALKHNPSLQRVLSLAPRQVTFEQLFRDPVFLGYNVGLVEGNDPTLVTSVAACLYAKDLDNVVLRTRLLHKRQALPLAVQEALVIASVKRTGLLKEFPEVSVATQKRVMDFLHEVAPLIQDKEALRRELRDKWFGTYGYYYFCGNLNNTRSNDTEKKKEGDGVN